MTINTKPGLLGQAGTSLIAEVAGADRSVSDPPIASKLEARLRLGKALSILGRKAA